MRRDLCGQTSLCARLYLSLVALSPPRAAYLTQLPDRNPVVPKRIRGGKQSLQPTPKCLFSQTLLRQFRLDLWHVVHCRLLRYTPSVCNSYHSKADTAFSTHTRGRESHPQLYIPSHFHDSVLISVLVNISNAKPPKSCSFAARNQHCEECLKLSATNKSCIYYST